MPHHCAVTANYYGKLATGMRNITRLQRVGYDVGGGAEGDVRRQEAGAKRGRQRDQGHGVGDVDGVVELHEYLDTIRASVVVVNFKATRHALGLQRVAARHGASAGGL
jgi:hypothetical protein